MLVTFKNIEQIYKLLTTNDLSTLTESLKILLAHTQLLEDSEYKKENQEQLKKLIQDNFNKINSEEIAETVNDHRAKFNVNIDKYLQEERLE